jgi:3-oxoacyl-[acyl-carrier protein] reductase
MVEVRDLKGSVVVIIGASSGIGLATAQAMLARLNEMMETNLQGTIWTVRAAVPYLKKNGGDIIIVCSISGYRSKKNQAVYAATKHAQVGLAIGLDDELREDGIRVTVIAPAATETNFAVGGGRELDDAVRSGYMQAGDVASAIETVLKQPRRLRTTLWQMISMSQGIL